ncbi:MAG: hypothetical protein WCP85_02765 [Mariniphaga sp.]
MELIFNELSVDPLSVDKYAGNDKAVKFAKAVSTAQKRGFKNIRSYLASNQILLSDGYTLYDWLHNNDRGTEVLRSFLYGMIVQPFIKDEDEAIEEKYVEADYFFEDKESNIEKTRCRGLASAFLYETLSTSLASANVWERVKLQLIIESEGINSPQAVLNISSQESFINEEISDFVEKLGPIELIETEILPDNKKIHLADHHGKAELTVLSNLLKKSPYVIEMRSTDWKGKRFIRKVSKDGVIEIVLIETQKQYALWVQTTGRNLRETNAIAKILEVKYS